MDAQSKLEPLYKKLGITSQAVKNKAEDHVRLLDYRAPTGITGNVQNYYISLIWWLKPGFCFFGWKYFDRQKCESSRRRLSSSLTEFPYPLASSRLFRL